MERENLCICPFDLFVFASKRLQKHGLLLSNPLDRLLKQAFEGPMYNYMYAIFQLAQVCTARRVDVTSSCKTNAGLGTCRHPARQMLVWALAVILQDKCWSGHLPSSCKANAGLGTCRHPARQTLAGAALSSKWNSIAWRPSLLGTPRFDV